MADYNRFVSYIYHYERGMKAMNTGFAKVESRGGQCRISITMKNMYHESRVKFSVYMFVRESGKLLGIYLGDLNTQNNTGEFFVVTDSENIEASGYSLDDVRGMIIRGDNGKIYGTGWDDEALAVDYFIPIGEMEQVGAVSDSAAPESSAPEAAATAIAPEQPSAAAMAPEQPPAAAIAPEQPSAAAMTPEQPPAAAITPEQPSAAAIAPDQPSAAARALMPEPSSIAAFAQEHIEPDTSERGLSALVAESVGALVKSWQDMPKEDAFEYQPEAAPMRVLEGGLGARENEKQNSLEKLIDTGMRMYPFEDDEIAACVRMEPQDIGLLPMEYWRLGGNSFLLHGYYSYRHLIMAQKNDGAYVFGIPGVNYERESFMAKMFGFNEFKPVRANASGGNEFGYWLMEIKAEA